MIERTPLKPRSIVIRPFLQTDDADIEFVDARTDCVSVRLIGLGQCTFAPLSMHMGLGVTRPVNPPRVE